MGYVGEGLERWGRRGARIFFFILVLILADSGAGESIDATCRFVKAPGFQAKGPIALRPGVAPEDIPLRLKSSGLRWLVRQPLSGAGGGNVLAVIKRLLFRPCHTVRTGKGQPVGRASVMGITLCIFP